jgi:hypothetical protein
VNSFSRNLVFSHWLNLENSSRESRWIKSMRLLTSEWLDRHGNQSQLALESSASRLVVYLTFYLIRDC